MVKGLGFRVQGLECDEPDPPAFFSSANSSSAPLLAYPGTLTVGLFTL